MSIVRGWLAAALPLVFLAACASTAAKPPADAASRAPRAAVAANDKATPASAPADKTTDAAPAGVRVRHGAPGCDGDIFALVGTAHSRTEPHWIDCRTGERVEYADAEFDAWFAARHAARAPAVESR